MGDDAGGGGQAMSLRSGVEVSPKSSRLYRSDPAARIDLDPAHLGEVDHHSPLAQCGTGDAVTTAADRHRQALPLRIRQAGDSSCGVAAPQYQRRPPVDGVVPQTPSGFVARGFGPDLGAVDLMPRQHGLRRRGYAAKYLP